MTSNLTTNLNNIFRSTKTEIENIKAILELIGNNGGGAEITYADNTTADLEKVKYQTTSTYTGRSSFPTNQMDVVEDIGDNCNPLYFANVKTISASTSYTYQQNGTFCTGSSSVATVTITKSGSSVTVYGNIVRIPRGCTFTSSVAGKFFFDDNYYGYLAS